MDTVYIAALWGPALAIFLMGLVLISNKRATNNWVAIITPICLAVVDTVIVGTIYSNGSTEAKGSEIVPVLETQALMLFIVVVILSGVMVSIHSFNLKLPVKTLG